MIMKGIDVYIHLKFCQSLSLPSNFLLLLVYFLTWSTYAFQIESERIATELQRKRDLDKVAEEERQREKVRHFLLPVSCSLLG